MNEEKKKIGVGVGVMLYRDGKVLFGLRPNKPGRSELRLEGTWSFPGGKVEYGESFEEAARREVLEESGIALDEVHVIALNTDKNEHAHYVTIGLYSDKFTGEPRVLEPEEMMEWRWFDLDDLPSPVYFPSAKLIENYKKGEFYIQKNENQK